MSKIIYNYIHANMFLFHHFIDHVRWNYITISSSSALSPATREKLRWQISSSRKNLRWSASRTLSEADPIATLASSHNHSLYTLDNEVESESYLIDSESCRNRSLSSSCSSDLHCLDDFCSEWLNSKDHDWIRFPYYNIKKIWLFDKKTIGLISWDFN